MILVVSSPRDEHAQRVLQELDHIGAARCLLDLSEFPECVDLVVKHAPQRRGDALLRWDGLRTIDLSSVAAIWWRRPQPFGIAAAITRQSHRTFAFNESHEAFAGLWHMLHGFWVNHPARDEIAAHKVYQLQVAHDVGLEIPETLITNSPDEARQFIDHRGCANTVYKAFSATEHEWRETRIVHEEELSLLDNVRHAPVIFQEYIPAGCDVRVTIVGSRVFAAAIHARDTAYPIDFRIDMNAARIEPIELPSEFQSRLQALMNRLGLAYGAVDLRESPAGRLVFLEINPAGQWLFVEQRTGQPIAASLAQLLADHSG